MKLSTCLQKYSKMPDLVVSSAHCLLSSDSWNKIKIDFGILVTGFFIYGVGWLSYGFILANFQLQYLLHYCRLVGFPPFWHRKQMYMLRAIMEGRYAFHSPEWDDISEPPKDLVSRWKVTCKIKCTCLVPFWETNCMTDHPHFRPVILSPVYMVKYGEGSLMRVLLKDYLFVCTTVSGGLVDKRLL